MILACVRKVDAGVVTDLQTGVNAIGGTPIKPKAQRMTQDSQLHRDTESMQPEVDSKIEQMVPGTAGPGSTGISGKSGHD
jgi:hypothetical protein